MLRQLLASVLASAGLLATQVIAVPILQLGPDPADSSASYDTVSETWFFSASGSGFSFNAYNLGPDLTAYIVLASVPMLMTDVFDVTVSDGTATLSLVDSGYGTPPFEDPNSLSPHGIYDSWSEIYQITFDGPLGTVPNTQPGDSGTDNGYTETVTVTVNSTDPLLTGIHVDMFTADYDAEKDKDIVTAFAPYSHDGQYTAVVPVPAAVWLFGSGLLGLVAIARRKKV